MFKRLCISENPGRIDIGKTQAKENLVFKNFSQTNIQNTLIQWNHLSIKHILVLKPGLIQMIHLFICIIIGGIHEARKCIALIYKNVRVHSAQFRDINILPTSFPNFKFPNKISFCCEVVSLCLCGCVTVRISVCKVVYASLNKGVSPRISVE